MHGFTFNYIVLISALVVHVAGHGVVTSPKPRQYGPVAEAACGKAVYNVLTSDLEGPIEFAVQKEDFSFDAASCPLFFCRGASIEDNADNTRKYAAGEVINFKIDLEAHHTGTANVSVVDLTSQKPIGAPLFYWPVYANESLGPDEWPKNETDFDVTIPNLKGQCSDVGNCAIQWWWYAYSNDQTYESCVDFTQ